MSVSLLDRLRHGRPHAEHSRAVRGRALFLLLPADVPILLMFVPSRRAAGVRNGVPIVNAVALAARLGRDACASNPRAVSIGHLLTAAGVSARTVPGTHPVSVGPPAEAGVYVDPERGGQQARATATPGLGLSPSRRIVRADRGEIRVGSTPGVGSACGLTLEVVR